MKVERVAAGQFRIGAVLLNKTEKSVTFPAEINMEKGLLEYLLVHTGGKTHESLLRTAVQPTELQMALLLLGLEGTSQPLAGQGAHQTPTGDPVAITISVAGSDGRISSRIPRDWVLKKSRDGLRPPEEMNFVFTGSLISGGRFMAQAEGSMISIYRDPAAIVDNASPGGDDDEIWFVREGSLPPVGTPVKVTIVSVK